MRETPWIRGFHFPEDGRKDSHGIWVVYIWYLYTSLFVYIYICIYIYIHVFCCYLIEIKNIDVTCWQSNASRCDDVIVSYDFPGSRSSRKYSGPGRVYLFHTLPATNIASENWWLEDYFHFGKVYFQGYARFREGDFADVTLKRGSRLMKCDQSWSVFWPIQNLLRVHFHYNPLIKYWEYWEHLGWSR